MSKFNAENRKHLIHLLWDTGNWDESNPQIEELFTKSIYIFRDAFRVEHSFKEIVNLDLWFDELVDSTSYLATYFSHYANNKDIHLQQDQLLRFIEVNLPHLLDVNYLDEIAAKYHDKEELLEYYSYGAATRLIQYFYNHLEDGEPLIQAQVYKIKQSAKNNVLKVKRTVLGAFCYDAYHANIGDRADGLMFQAKNVWAECGFKVDMPERVEKEYKKERGLRHDIILDVFPFLSKPHVKIMTEYYESLGLKVN